MSKMWILGIALVLLLVPFVLISVGTTQDAPELWWVGLALLVIGALIPPATRFLFPEDEQEGDDEADAASDDDRQRAGRDEHDAEPPSLEQVRVEPIATQQAPRLSRSDDPAARSHEHQAEAHTERAEAHRRLAEALRAEAKAHDEEARAEEARARAEAERARSAGGLIPPAPPRHQDQRPDERDD